jgi:hypothetical protein
VFHPRAPLQEEAPRTLAAGEPVTLAHRSLVLARRPAA